MNRWAFPRWREMSLAIGSCQVRGNECHSVVGAEQGAYSGGAMSATSLPVEKQVEHVAERLVHDFAGSVDDAEVRSLVSASYTEFSDAKVQQFVPVLVDRSVRQQLRGRL